MIRFSCPGCGAVYSVTDDKAGKTGKCPKCQTPFTIPAAEAPAPAPPPPPVSSNPFSALSGDDDDAPRKKSPSKADLDDRPKKKPARRDDDDFDDAPPVKKPATAAGDDDFADFDAAPSKKKAKGRRDDDDFDDDAPPRKKAKGRRDDDDYDDDYDDAPKKKAKGRRDDDDFDDDYDDRPRKRKSRRDDDYDDDFDDDYDDRPRKRKGKSGLLLTAAILHIITAVLYIPCGGFGLAGAGMLGSVVGASNAGVQVNADRIRRTGTVEQKANLAEAEKLLSQASTALTILQIILVLALLAGILAIPAAVGGFMKKKWFTYLSLATGGLLILYSLLYLVLTAMYVPFNFVGVLLMMLLPISFGVVAILAAVNKNVKRVLS